MISLLTSKAVLFIIVLIIKEVYSDIVCSEKCNKCDLNSCIECIEGFYYDTSS